MGDGIKERRQNTLICFRIVRRDLAAQMVQATTFCSWLKPTMFVFPMFAPGLTSLFCSLFCCVSYASFQTPRPMSPLRRASVLPSIARSCPAVPLTRPLSTALARNKNMFLHTKLQDGMIPRRQPSRPASGAPSPNGLNGVVVNGGGHHHQRHRPNSEAYSYHHNLHLQQQHNGGGGSGGIRPHHHKRKLTAEAAEDLLLDGANGGPAVAGKRGGGGVGDAHPPPLAVSAAAAHAAAGMPPSASSSSVSGLLTTATNRGAGIGIVGDSDRGGGVGGLLAEEGGFFTRSTAVAAVGGRGHGRGGGGSGGSSGSGARGRSGAGGWSGRGAGGAGGEVAAGVGGAAAAGLFGSVSRPVSRQHRTAAAGTAAAGRDSGSIGLDRAIRDDWLSASGPAAEAEGGGDETGPLLAGEVAAGRGDSAAAAAAATPTAAAARKAGTASASGGLFTV